MDPNNSQLVRDIRESLYDTYSVAKTTAMPLRIILFGDPSNSGVGQTKPERTNLTQVGQLPNPESHNVYAVIVEFVGMLASDIIGICQSYVLQVAVNGRPMLTMPLTPTDSTGKVIATVASDIILSASARIDLPEDYKIEIQAGAPFMATLIGSTAWTTVTTNGVGAFLRVRLDGVHTVAVN
jgi:hypothetical protein